MRGMTKRNSRGMTEGVAGGRLAAGACDRCPDGAAATISGGAMTERGRRAVSAQSESGVSRGGAVSGAARAIVSVRGSRAGRDRVVALSDGSRITFASIGDAGFSWDHDGPLRGSDLAEF
jgi:hypothetical protein